MVNDEKYSFGFNLKAFEIVVLKVL